MPTSLLLLPPGSTPLCPIPPPPPPLTPCWCPLLTASLLLITHGLPPCPLGTHIHPQVQANVGRCWRPEAVQHAVWAVGRAMEVAQCHLTNPSDFNRPLPLMCNQVGVGSVLMRSEVGWGECVCVGGVLSGWRCGNGRL